MRVLFILLFGLFWLMVISLTCMQLVLDDLFAFGV